MMTWQEALDIADPLYPGLDLRSCCSEEHPYHANWRHSIFFFAADPPPPDESTVPAAVRPHGCCPENPFEYLISQE
jgi:hypothetical protein